MMLKEIESQVVREYALELLDCMLHEFEKLDNFDRIVLFRSNHDFIVSEYNKEKALLLSDKRNQEKYERLKGEIDALLPDKRDQLKRIADMRDILALVGEDTCS